MLECGGPHTPNAHTQQGMVDHDTLWLTKCIIMLKLGSFVTLECGGPHTPIAHIQQGMVDHDTL